MQRLCADRKHPIARVLFVLLALATLWKVWVGPVDTASAAYAQIPDSAAQRNQIIQQVRRTNELLEKIELMLRTGTIKVRIEGADNADDGRKARP